MKVTIEMLRSLGACKDAVKLFDSLFGEGVEVTKGSLICASQGGLDLWWFGYAAWGERFRDLERPLWEGYKADEQEAGAQYQRNMDVIWAKYESENSISFSEFTAAERDAYTIYKATLSELWAAYKASAIPVILQLSEESPVA